MWLPGTSAFLAGARLSDNWMMQIHVEESRLDEDYDENRGNTDAFAKLIGIVTEFASTYLGFVTADDDDDLSFMEEDPPVQLEEPLAMVYLGRRYPSDWPDEPQWAADPKARWRLPAGVLLVPASSPLEIEPGRRAKSRRVSTLIWCSRLGRACVTGTDLALRYGWGMMCRWKQASCCAELGPITGAVSTPTTRMKATSMRTAWMLRARYGLRIAG